MLRRSLFACALMLAGVVGFASSAKADMKTMTFTTNVSATCNLTAPATGTGSFEGALALEDDTTKNKLVTTTPARVGINCTGGNLKVSTPVLSSKPATFTPGTAPANTATITTKANNTVADTTATGLLLVEADKGDAVVQMTSTLTGADTFIPGNYSYTVTVTATPGG